MKPFLTATGLLALSAAPAAQGSVTMEVTAPITIVCSDGATVSTDTQPVGAASSFYLSAATPHSYAAVSSETHYSDTGMRVTVGVRTDLGNPAPTGAIAVIAPASVLVHLSCATTTAVYWNPIFTDLTQAGSLQPGIDIDFGDDGVLEYVNGNQVSLTLPLSLEPQPLPVRITFSSSALTPGIAASSLILEALPATAISSTLAAVSCTAPGITALPTFFDNGVRLKASSFQPMMPWLAMVIGWDTAPVLLPSLGQSPCLLLPTPDIVVLQGLGIAPLDVPLPPAVRPVRFWVQGVIPDSQLLTTDCLRIDAQ